MVLRETSCAWDQLVELLHALARTVFLCLGLNDADVPFWPMLASVRKNG